MLDSPRWHPKLYAGSAGFYRQGRLPYAPGLKDALKNALDLDGRGRLLDVGCGPGPISIAMASLFEEVVGIDADAEMSSEASAAASRARISNAQWVTLRAEDLPGAGLGQFRVATFAQSFHWMDREQVAASLRHILDPGLGALVQIYAYTVRGANSQAPMPHPAPPRDQISGLIDRFLKENRRAPGRAAEVQPGEDDDVLRRAGFSGPKVVTVPDDRVLTRSADDIVASVYSVSNSAPELFGVRRSDFDSALRRLLDGVSESGLFCERTHDNQLRIWRQPTGEQAGPSSS